MTQHRRRTSFVTCAAVLVTLFVFDRAGRYAWSESLFDESVRAQMFKHSDGLIAHIKTEYNNIFIVKHKRFLFLRLGSEVKIASKRSSTWKIRTT